MADTKKLDNMFSEFDETECVMIAAGIEEAAVDHDVEKIANDEEEDDLFDETIEDIGQTFTMEDIPAQSYRKAACEVIAKESEDRLEEAVMELLEGEEFDDDVEDIADDDDNDLIDDDEFEDYIDECL